MDTNVSNSLQFLIKELSIILPSGENVDISGTWDEINLYESMFTPCRSGNILIREGIGLYNKLNFKGNETIRFRVQKSDSDVDLFKYYKEFKIYKVTNRKNISSTSQAYILHFVNEDFVYSMQKRISRCYTGLYSDIVKKILIDDLKVSNSKPLKGKSGISEFYNTDSFREFVVPNLSPFQAIDWITKRSVSTKYKTPDYLFFENEFGYNFTSISSLWTKPVRFNINVKPKNLIPDIQDEFYGARDMKILSQFSMLDNIRDGVYAGRFVGFDTFTKTLSITDVKNNYNTTSSHGNKNSNLTNAKTKDKKDFNEMYDSRIVSYPYALPRTTSTYIKENSSKSSSVIDNTHDYIFQRRAFFSNMLQKRVELTLPGNFSYACGSLINLDVPKFSAKEDEKNTDDTLSGKYIVLGVRHIIQYNRHETLIEVATDSAKK
jgi:hypothetical protein